MNEAPSFRATELAHSWVRDRLRPGDVAVDATTGNGHDTLFLAEIVGSDGNVFAFDVQPQAIEASRRLLAEHALQQRVNWIHEGHETMIQHLSRHEGAVGAIMFNLGYLPGGNKELTTQPDLTLAALNSSLAVLRPGGIVTVVCYIGHPGGLEEAEAVLRFCRQLDPKLARAYRCDRLNAEHAAPFVIALEKLA